jgi:hypothetical protein
MGRYEVREFTAEALDDAARLLVQTASATPTHDARAEPGRAIV